MHYRILEARFPENSPTAIPYFTAPFNKLTFPDFDIATFTLGERKHAGVNAHSDNRVSVGVKTPDNQEIFSPDFSLDGATDLSEVTLLVSTLVRFLVLDNDMYVYPRKYRPKALLQRLPYDAQKKVLMCAGKILVKSRYKAAEVSTMFKPQRYRLFTAEGLEGFLTERENQTFRAEVVAAIEGTLPKIPLVYK